MILDRVAQWFSGKRVAGTACWSWYYFLRVGEDGNVETVPSLQKKKKTIYVHESPCFSYISRLGHNNNNFVRRWYGGNYRRKNAHRSHIWVSDNTLFCNNKLATMSRDAVWFAKSRDPDSGRPATTLVDGTIFYTVLWSLILNHRAVGRSRHGARFVLQIRYLSSGPVATSPLVAQTRHFLGFRVETPIDRRA